MKYFSVFQNDGDILRAIKDIHLKCNEIDLDCTYSKGIFYKKIEEPVMKSDLNPLFEDVIKADCRELSFIKNNSLGSIVFDPPFLFRNRKSENLDKISNRFSYFKSYNELLEMYSKSLECFYTKLKKNGFVLFKCQDMTDGKFYATHIDIINIALQIGFSLKDIGIKISTKKIQKEAKQQNCFAKTHSYWLILKK